jgi:mannose-6-phosphate isomerase-like protein (cupin superfamily)
MIKNKMQDFGGIGVEKPWGYYSILIKEKDFLVKVICVNPNCKLSLQYHNHRSENWVVTEGTAMATVGEMTVLLYPSQTVFVPVKEIHRIANPSDSGILKIIEVQTGDYLEEDDIVRLEDDYPRT